jgi:hypothetical protein
VSQRLHIPSWGTPYPRESAAQGLLTERFQQRAPRATPQALFAREIALLGTVPWYLVAGVPYLVRAQSLKKSISKLSTLLLLAVIASVASTSEGLGLRLLLARSQAAFTRWEEPTQAPLAHELAVLGWVVLDVGVVVRSQDIVADLRVAMNDGSLVLDASDALLFMEPMACHLQVGRGRLRVVARRALYQAQLSAMHHCTTSICL